MGKTAAALIMALLVAAAAITQLVSVVNAGTMPEDLAVYVLSPLDKQIINSSDLPLRFSVTKPQSWFEVFPGYSGGILYWAVGYVTHVGYALDGKESENITANDPSGSLTIGPPPPKVFESSFNLTGLSEGIHNLTVNVFGNYKADTFNYSRSLTFFVDTVPLELTIISPENKVYNIMDIPLTLTSTEPVSWLGYNLDGEDRVTITENTTLKGLSAGSHNLTLFGNDTIGNLATSETLTFTVAVPEAGPEPFPTVPVAVVSAVVIAAIGVTAGLILARRRRRKEAQQT